MGLLVSVGPSGDVTDAVPCDGPQGILAVAGGYLVARHNVVELRDRQLRYVRDVASYPWFNDLHSLRPSGQGVLVAASGTDSITEVGPAGELRWRWWGTENGFTTDSFGAPRELSQLDDHRMFVYDTWLQATHVNSALPFGPGIVLATLFHQGALIAIERQSGYARILLAGLARPHALRHGPGMLTVADTANGTGIAGKVVGTERPGDCRFEIDYRIVVRTGWLQDWHALDRGIFLAVDGEQPAVVFLTGSGEVIRRDEFDPDWYLYEAAMKAPAA